MQVTGLFVTSVAVFPFLISVVVISMNRTNKVNMGNKNDVRRMCVSGSHRQESVEMPVL